VKNAQSTQEMFLTAKLINRWNFTTFFFVIWKRQNMEPRHFSITTFSITTFSIIDLLITLSINDTQHINTWQKNCMSLFWVSHFLIVMLNIILLSFIMLSVFMLNVIVLSLMVTKIWWRIRRACNTFKPNPMYVGKARSLPKFLANLQAKRIS
jgi:hypothetical protein